MHGLNQTVILLFFLATAPVGLMPSIIALFTRQHRRPLIVIANLLLWALIYWGARSFTIEGSTGYRLPTFLALLGWLVLLGFSIRNSAKKHAAAQAE
ncbi:MAG: hypothetical protein Q4G62_03320 [Pseudomonadota bacterium]|nr:hypothetical protein [Pseudomonadota bacterium]